MTEGRRSALRVTLVGGGITVVGVLPVFLTGAMAVQITGDLQFGTAGLGLAIGIFRGAGALTAVFMGRLVDRLGGIWSVRLAASVAVVVSLGIALAAHSWWQLVAWLVVGSCANTLAQPAANRMLINNVPAHRQGVAFGVKQSAPPTASMLAGLSVPAVALTLGWRWAYGIGTVLAVLVAICAGRPSGRRQPTAPRAGETSNDRPTMLVFLAAAFGIGTAASSTVPAFYVDAAVASGSSQPLAGTMLAVASTAAILTRFGGGVVSDRLRTGHLRLCAALIVAGALGMGLLATADTGAMAVGVVIALAGTWGFNGIFFYAVVRTRPERPGAVTGALMPGALTGTSVGPILFGALASTTGYQAAWLAATAVALVGAVAMFVSERRLAVPSEVT